MKYIKILFFVVWLTIVTLITAVLGLIGAAFTKGRSMRSCLQALEFWKVVRATFTGSPNKVQLFLKTEISKKRYGEPVMYVDIDAIDYKEIFVYSLYSFYLGFYIWIIGGAILSAILYQAIYVSPVSTTIETPPKKDIITYQKNETDVNKDLYCPCTPLFETNSVKNKTLLIDQDNGIVLVSDEHELTSELIDKSEFEHSTDIQSYVSNKSITIEFEGVSFKVKEKQAFVFSYDLDSLYFFYGKELRRVAMR